MKYLFIASFSLVLTSCAFHAGNISTGGIIDCPLKAIVEGEASTMRVFGIGGLSKNALINEAKMDLYANCRLRKGVHITNFSVDYKFTFLPFIIIEKTTVTADVFDCNGGYSSDSATTNNELFIERKKGFKVGDSVISMPNMRKGIIKEFSGGKVIIQYQNQPGKIVYNVSTGNPNEGEVKYKKTFKITPELENQYQFGYNIGETYLARIPGTVVDRKCKIIGLNKKQALVEYTTDKGTIGQGVVTKIEFKK